MVDIKVGSVLSGKRWSEPVLVNTVENVGNLLRVVGTTRYTKRLIDSLIPLSELSAIEVLSDSTAFGAEPGEVFLSLECLRYRYASLYDPLLAMNTSKIHPLPHQIEAVYGYVLRNPKIRFLIADDPGAGKTIMAGLIIKELKLRKVIKRTLIVAPGHLKDQWRRELKERFEERFIVIDRGQLDTRYGENIWETESQIITSIDFAKREEILPSISAVDFDLIIVDEAHKMSATAYGDKISRTNRYRLGEVLSKSTEHLLFLTATPHRGDPENFRLFLDLLEPGYFSTKELLGESIQNRDNPLFIRRVKEELKDFDGKPLFLPRHVSTVSFKLDEEDDEEKELYNDLSRYVNEQYNKALSKDKKRNIAFALVILQRRFASSTYALLKSLERRKDRLEEMLKTAELRQSMPQINYDDIEDMSEEDRWKEEELWEALSVSENRNELKAEIHTLDNLIQRAKKIISQESETKLKHLKESLVELSGKFSDLHDQKILVFTESRDTLDYLERKLMEWGYTVTTIHGGMRLEDRIAAESIFKNEKQIMVATEAAGEGINLQFCHMMINYDIPWNPNRLEQRMGRIHRYGQNREVFVFNMVAEDTREGMVLKRLFDKLDEIRRALGNDKVFDVLSEVFYGRDFPQMLTEAAANARNIDEIIKEMDIWVDHERNSELKDILGDSLASSFIDYTRIREMAQRAREHKLIPEYTERFFRKAFEKAGGIMKPRGEFFALEQVPVKLRQLDGIQNKRILRSYPKITFDNEQAFRHPDVEFITFGHPLFESLLDWVSDEYGLTPLEGATFVDPDGRMNGYIFFFEGEITDGEGKTAGKRLFACFTNDDEINPVSPDIIWDLKEEKLECNSADIQELKKKAASYSIGELEKYLKELQEERDHQGEIKEKYGVRSLEHLIIKLDGELIDLQARKDRGEDVDLAMRNKQDRKQRYEQQLKNLIQQIESERSLTMSMPQFAGVIRVFPEKPSDPFMVSDPEIEKIGMDISMNYERQHDREPQDVSAENLGFDIRSKLMDGTFRYIEVKARATTGPVELTQNEWLKAKRFGSDYFLYVVLNAAKEPELYIIQDPANNLTPTERIESVRYLVSPNQIKNYPIDNS